MFKIFNVIVLSFISSFFGISNFNRQFSPDSGNIKFDELSVVDKKYKKKCLKIDSKDMVSPESPMPECGLYYCDCDDLSYYPSTSFNMVDFFKNAYEYIPWNSAGSCGYVSLIEVMSFYDTFYNDDIIPENYDRHFEYATNIDESIADSPGVVRQSYDPTSYDSYYDFCYRTQSFDLQSKLSIINNLINNNSTYSFNPSIGGGEYQSLLNAFYSNSNNVLVNDHYFDNVADYVELIKDVIDTGNPAIVQVCNSSPSSPNDYDHHSVVVYDYDSFGLYMNNGLYRTNTHSLLFNDYNKIYGVYVLDYSNMGHSHSNNYVINGECFCGCNVEVSGLQFESSPEWTNVPPTIKWIKNIYDPTESYTIGFKHSINGSFIASTHTNKNRFTPSYCQWKSIMDNLNGWIYVCLQRHSDVFHYDYNSHLAFFKPVYRLNSFKISPCEYGFADAYPVDSKIAEKYQRMLIPNSSVPFRTRRFRTGYIHNEYIVMSCIRENVNEAYIEYAFNSPISGIQVDLSYWRSPSYEYLTSSNGLAELQFWVEPNVSNLFQGRWERALDLLSEETNLPTDRTKQTRYEINFTTQVYSFRFYSKTNVTYHNNNNKGRICIGDLIIRFA